MTPSTASTGVRYNTDEVLADDLDGEIILLHLPTGNYFSLAGSGADVWRLLAEGASVETVIETLQRDHPGHADSIPSLLRAFVSGLIRESLLNPADGLNMEESESSSPEATPLPTLVLNKYTDMQDLLLLDPIHEVDEAGWPASKK